MRITNQADVSLSLAVWLIADNYDYIDIPNYISVTTLMKPIRQIVLPSRVPEGARTQDVMDFVARARGHAVHDSMEKAWTHNYRRSLKLLGYPDAAIDRIKINPEPSDLTPDTIPIYLEQRSFKEVTVRGVTYTIGGKYDMVARGYIEDTKSTSAYGWTYGTRDAEHQLQMSLYKWLRPDIITEDVGRINYVFTDWQKMLAKGNPAYPQKPVEQKEIELMSVEQTNNWVECKLIEYDQFKNQPEELLPECTDEQLWRSDPKWKYFSDPSKVDGKSTKNFDNAADAHQHKADKGKGVVIEVPGEVKACGYCAGFEACKQKDQYFAV